MQNFDIKCSIFCGTCKETGEEFVRAIQSTGVRADVAASLENQAPERRTRAQASMSIDRSRYSIESIVDQSTKTIDRATIRVDVACTNSNALTIVDNPIRIF